MTDIKKRSTRGITRTLGSRGVPTFGGFIVDNEKDPSLAAAGARYATYSNMLLNTAIVAAGVRYFTNLVGSASWTIVPADKDKNERVADEIRKALMEDPLTPWHRIVRRASMYRFYGFSLQEWTAKRRDGIITFADIEPRAQKTIERWKLNNRGDVTGVYQRDQTTFEEIFLPRKKLVYVVDDTLSDSPEGLGVFRQLVAPVRRLNRYEQLEGVGFETDLRGLLVCRIPASILQRLQTNEEISEEERKELEKPLRKFAESHIRDPKLAVLLDSAVYESQDASETPSSNRLWDVEILTGEATSFPENADAIERLNREIARILGIEQMLLGEKTGGSYALSKDKTQNFFLIVTGVLKEISNAFNRDLVTPLMQLNGWAENLRPRIVTEGIAHNDVTQITEAIERIARSGAMLDVKDPILNHLRELLGAPAAKKYIPTNERSNASDKQMKNPNTIRATVTKPPTGAPKKKQ